MLTFDLVSACPSSDSMSTSTASLVGGVSLYPVLLPPSEDRVYVALPTLAVDRFVWGVRKRASPPGSVASASELNTLVWGSLLFDAVFFIEGDTLAGLAFVVFALADAFLGLSLGLALPK